MDTASTKVAFEQVLSTPGERRMVVISHAPFLIAAVNDKGRAALFVRVSLTPSQVVRDGHGFSVKTARSGDNDYLQIAAADVGLPPLFLKLAEYVVERVTAADSPEEGTVSLLRSIDEYRRFVGERRGRLSESLVRGTFAELLFMDLLLESGMSADTAVAAWRGPWAKAGLGVHDFTFADGHGIEVKSTRQPPTRIRVSSPGQLVPSQDPLDLLVLPLEDASHGSGSAISFRNQAQEIGALVRLAGARAAETWDAALAVLALDLDDEWYDQFRFVPGEWRRYRVTTGFPCLDVSSVPPGVVDIRYSLELASLAPFSARLRDLINEMGLQ